MSSRLLTVSLASGISGYGLAGFVAALVVLVKLAQPSKVSVQVTIGNAFPPQSWLIPQLHAIPTVGSSSWLGSWWAGIKYLKNAVDVIQEGYEKASLILCMQVRARSFMVFQHKGAPFKVAALHRWTVMIGSREHVEELRGAPDDTLSFLEAANYASDDFPPAQSICIEYHQQQLQVEYTMSPQIHHNPYHIPILQSKLTRSIGALYPGIRDEIITALDDILDLNGNGEYPALLPFAIHECWNTQNGRAFWHEAAWNM